MISHRNLGRVLAGIAIVLFGIRLAPQALAFPFYAEANGLRVWSEQPIDSARLHTVTAMAQTLVAASPLASPIEQRDVFLTQGGWRWQLLALTSRGAFAISSAGTEDVIINRSSLAENAVWNRQEVGGRRSLSGILAHELTHGLIRRRFGVLPSMAKPTWLIEGYCDHVARESSLSDTDVAKLTAAGKSHPALVYHQGRRSVAAALEANGNNVDALFAAAD